MSNILTAGIFIALTIVVVKVDRWYYNKIIKAIALEHKEPIYISWHDFIIANINSSFQPGHCHQCRELIFLFDLKFRGQIPTHNFLRDLDNMYNRLDTKYRAILNQDELSEISIDEFIN